MPAVSICIPTYNQLSHFKRALNSVFIQEFRDYEIIVTDDSSNEDIYEYIKESNLLGSIQYSRNNPPLGPSANWNSGLLMAKGDFIKILHHDDQFSDSTSLGKFVDALKSNPSINIAFCSPLNCSEKTGIETIFKPKLRDLRDLSSSPNILFCGNFVGPPSGTIFRATQKYLFDETLRYIVDIDFYVKNWIGGDFLYLSEALVRVAVDSPSQLTRTNERNSQIILFEYFKLFHSLVNNLSNYEFRKCIRMLKIILASLNVKNIDQIRDAGYFGPIPKEISRFILIIRANQLLAKCLAKL